MEWFGKATYERSHCHHTLDETPDPAEFEMHTHAEYELYYFVQGRGAYCVEGKVYPLQPGDVFLMRTAETHSLQIRPEEPYERVAIHFSPSLLSERLCQNLLKPFEDRPLGMMNRYSASEMPSPFIKDCMERLFCKKPTEEERILVYLLPILQEIYDVWQVRTCTEYPEQPQEISVQLVSYINLHLNELTSLSQLEKHFFLSQSQINRIFRRTTGSSVWEYIQVKRLFSARQMLHEGVTPFQAASACGYHEYSTFFRAYKKRFGHAPQQDLPARKTDSNI